MEEKLLIREAKEQDLEVVYEMNKQLVLSFCDLTCTNKDFIQQRIQEKNVIVAELNSIIVGSCIFEVFKNKYVINSLSVDKEKHNNGIGSSLLKFILNKWQESDCLEINVGTFEEYNAKDFYSKYGFIVKNEHAMLYDDNELHTGYILAKWK